MGKKLDALLGRRFKTSKFKATVSLAISRLAVLKNQRQARCSIARSDVVEFLKNSNHERALLRVEQVIKEQNMLDVFVVLEGYCHLLMERVNHFEQEKVCPEELNEAVATLIYAATRCGEFPELQELRGIFTSRFGKEFSARAVELRNNCGVNPKIVQKLSTRMPSLENKMKVLKEIATDNNIDLPIEETLSDNTVEIKDSGQEKQQNSGQSAPTGVISNQGENESLHPDDIERGPRRKYKDVADAAQAAFESAAYAAAAARAAVELSRSESIDPDDPNSPSLHPRKVSPMIEPMEAIHQKDETEMESDKTHLVQNYDLEPEDRNLQVAKGMEQFESNQGGTLFKRSFSASSSDSLDDNVKGVGISSDEEGKIKLRDVVFDESDDEDEQKSWNNMDADKNAQFRLKRERGPGNYPGKFVAEKRTQAVEPLNINRRPISVRNRWAQGR